MKNKLIVCLALLIGTLNFASAQINVQFTKNVFSEFQREDLWGFMINSSFGTGTCHAKISLIDKRNESIVLVVTPEFTLLPGINIIPENIKNRSNFDYSASVTSSYFRKLNMLENGNYTICVTVTYLTEYITTTETCNSFSIEQLMHLVQIMPRDEEKIPTLGPIISWMPLALSPENVSYHLKLVEIKKSQSKEEAITQNTKLIDRNTNSETNIAYPPEAIPLQYGKEYAWQVEAVKNSEIMASSEVWKFKCDTRLKKVKSKEDSYRLINSGTQMGEYVFNDIIKFAYENRGIQENLSYDIISQKTGRAIDCIIQIPIRQGLNKIDIDLSNCALHAEEHYLLTVHDDNHSSFQLKFIKHEKKNSRTELIED